MLLFLSVVLLLLTAAVNTLFAEVCGGEVLERIHAKLELDSYIVPPWIQRDREQLARRCFARMAPQVLGGVL